MMETAPAGFDLLSLLPILIFSVPYALAAFWISPKMGANRWVWLVLVLVPVVNWVAGPVFLVLIAGAILDRLNALTGN
jgi:hypothetical protein